LLSIWIWAIRANFGFDDWLQGPWPAASVSSLHCEVRPTCTITITKEGLIRKDGDGRERLRRRINNPERPFSREGTTSACGPKGQITRGGRTHSNGRSPKVEELRQEGCVEIFNPQRRRREEEEFRCELVPPTEGVTVSRYSMRAYAKLLQQAIGEEKLNEGL
jgi:hypothetical protein